MYTYIYIYTIHICRLYALLTLKAGARICRHVDGIDDLQGLGPSSQELHLTRATPHLGAPIWDPHHGVARHPRLGGQQKGVSILWYIPNGNSRWKN